MKKIEMAGFTLIEIAVGIFLFFILTFSLVGFYQIIGQGFSLFEMEMQERQEAIKLIFILREAIWESGHFGCLEEGKIKNNPFSPSFEFTLLKNGEFRLRLLRIQALHLSILNIPDANRLILNTFISLEPAWFVLSNCLQGEFIYVDSIEKLAHPILFFQKPFEETYFQPLELNPVFSQEFRLRRDIKTGLFSLWLYENNHGEEILTDFRFLNVSLHLKTGMWLSDSLGHEKSDFDLIKMTFKTKSQGKGRGAWVYQCHLDRL